jgi:hypothetical protein
MSENESEDPVKGKIPANAPEQRRGGFATGESDPEKYPEDEKVGRFSTGQDEDEAIRKGSFARGQRADPRKIDPDEGFAEEERESSPTGTQGQDDDAE